MASDMGNNFREAGSKNLKSSEASEASETQESLGNHRDKARKGLRMTRTFSSPDISPFDQLEWEKREASIADETGKVIFNQKGVEIPKSWSQLATNVVASKYFYGEMGTPERERSVRQLIHRVARTIADWGKRDGYFYSDEDAEIFYDELSFLCLNQYGAFNSPVWFNVGLYHQYGIAGTKGGYYYDRLEHTAKRAETSYEYPQGSACQPYDAMISTPNGMIPIGGIVEKNLIGLKVYDKDGITEVVAVKSNGMKKVYRITLHNGIQIEATSDHLIYVSNDAWARKGCKFAWKPLSDVKPGDYMRLNLDKTITDTSVSNVTESEAALVGWLQTDGFAGKYDGTNRSWTIEAITVNDDEFKWVKTHLESVFPDKHYHVIEVPSKDPKLRIRRLRMYGKFLEAFIMKFGLHERKQNMAIPERIFRSSKSAICHYLRSAFQADGYISLRKNGAIVGFSVVSETYVLGIQRLLLSLGIYSKMNFAADKRTDRLGGYVLRIQNKSEREKFAQLIGFVDSSKSEKLSQSLKLEGKNKPVRAYEQIDSIVCLGEMPVFDIQTKSGSYLCNNVVLHNCFIQSVDDNMEDIMRLATSEAMLFKYGSGTGTDLSTIRGSKEKLSGGGRPSGPISFMRVYDQIAAVVKSGGKTRRAAKMQTLQVWHPDIVDFINCKPNEEKKAWALIERGYDGSYNGDAYNSIMFQNANLSVRVSDEFMRSALEDKEWHTRAVTTGEIVDTYKSRDLLGLMAEGAHVCGDPGIQYDTTINKWHTCPNSGRINSSNPCSEFMFLDETACNLASLNLMKFRKLDGSFDVEKFERAVEIFIMAQEIIVDNASYPTAKIAEKSHQFRPLGLGYANLGALIMSMGLPYDSDQGRAYAAAITAIMTGHAYYMSSQIAKSVGPFEGYQVNRDPMLRVIRMHREAAYKIDSENCSEEMYRAACDVWDRALESGIEYGYKNSQVTVLAPTGTISFMMDCDTTGIEPDIALVKYKLLAGGGLLKIVNRTVPEALAKLGYTEKQIDDIIKHIEKQDTIEGAPHLKDEHLAVFDCAFKPFNGTRSIQHMAHLKMMAATQPFLSGAISKTINMPKESSVEDIMEAYIEGWKLGLKAVAIYRDGSKRSQPLSTSLKSEEDTAPKPVRKRLPATRNSITHKFEIQGHEGYFTVGFYEDGTPGELFITMAKEGSTIGGLMDAFGTAISLGLQYGVPLKALVDKFVNSHFEPGGYTSSPEIPIAKSIVDYIFRWLGIHFVEGYAELMSKTAIEASLAAAEGQVQAQSLKSDESTEAGKADKSDKSDKSESKSVPNGTTRKIKRIDDQFAHFQDDAPICDSCGAITVRNGACYKCYNCGNAIGCS